MESLQGISAILRYRGHANLANLLARSSIDFDVSSQYGSYWNSLLTTAEIYAPLSDYDRLKTLSDQENDLILETIHEIWPPREEDMEIVDIAYRLDKDSLESVPVRTDAILELIHNVRNTLISVATNGPRINSVNEEYRINYSALAQELNAIGVSNPIPYSDLWQWYGKWSSGDLPTYQSRREYIRGLFEPLNELLLEGRSSHGTEVFPDATCWSLADRQLGEARRVLESASTEEQFQSVGLHCRETLISLARTVYDPDQHPPVNGDDVSVSDTDAKRMLDRFLVVEVSGSSNAQARRLAKVSLALANELQHRRTATFRQAALCAEATASVINIIAILSGVRDPSDNL
jgi:hypothetical protein